MSSHRLAWWAYSADTNGKSIRFRNTRELRGSWGYDVTCSCGWETNTGGGTRGHLSELVREHKWEHAA